MALLFKVWNYNRLNKICVTVGKDNAEILKTVIQKASEKLQIEGSTLVLENDGTRIDDDETLSILSNEVLILLQDKETWESSSCISDHAVSSPSTSNSTTFTCNNDTTVDIGIASQLEAEVEGRTEREGRTVDQEERTEEQEERLSESSWREFVIPWSKVGALALKDCEKGVRNKRTVTEVVHVVADALRVKKPHIPSKVLDRVADKIVEKYPKTFKDIDDDGVVVAKGSYSVFKKLEDRIKYLNRLSTSEKRSSECIETPNIPLKTKKKMLAAKAGCSNWQPSESINERTQAEIQENLKVADFSSINEATLILLNRSYSQQRLFLNREEPPSMIGIKEEWPILLSQNGIYWHYNKLMSQDITKLGEFILSKANKFIEFGLKKQYLDTYPVTEVDIILNVLLVISKYFNENLNCLYIPLHDEKDIYELLTVSPIIVALNLREGTKRKIGKNTLQEKEKKDNEKDNVEDKTITRYYVIMEKNKVNDGTESLRDALQQFFALYYMLNLEYPNLFRVHWNFCNVTL